jgi:spore coat polysaccharide biosynthesis protein SpsF
VLDVLCVVQARTGSSRLPGKVVADLGGRPMLRFMLDRLAAVAVDHLVVATSALDRDDAVVAIADQAGVGCVRGPEADVLARFAVALDRHPAATVVRLTADCPLVDPAVVEAVLERHRERNADFTCNVLPRTFPKGMDVEVAQSAALLQAHREAERPAEREHVMPYLYRHPEFFRLANLRSGEDAGGEHLTVDTADDLARVRRVVAALPPGAPTGWRDVLAVAGRSPGPPPGRVRLRPAEPADAGDILAWRNQPDAVRFSVAGTAIDAAEHARWFTAHVDDPGTRMWIGCRDGASLGSVRIDVRSAVGNVSIAVAPSRHGMGVGAELVRLLQQEVIRELQVDALTAAVHEENRASRRLFERAGFRPVATDGSFTTLRWETMDVGMEELS